MDDADTTWHLLRVKRIEAGLTVTGLAVAAELSVPYVWQLEAGHRGARPPTLRQLADALNDELGLGQQVTVLDLERTQPRRATRHREPPPNGAVA